MPVRKSIRDIQISGNISDIVSNPEVINIKKTRARKTESTIDNNVQETLSENIQQTQKTQSSTDIYVEKEKNNSVSIYKKITKNISKVKTVYLISFGLIILIITLLIFISTNSSKELDSTEQIKKEVETVKKQFSKHIILPTSEEIDIRKITNKIEDPFFKEANIGDYLIIFYKTRIAYVYSIDKDIIINAGVVFIDPKTTTTNSIKK